MHFPQAGSFAQAQEHDDEQEEHQYSTGVDKHLQRRQELGPQHYVQASELEEGDNQPQRRVHRVPAGNHHQRADDGEGRQRPEDEHPERYYVHSKERDHASSSVRIAYCVLRIAYWVLAKSGCTTHWPSSFTQYAIRTTCLSGCPWCRPPCRLEARRCMLPRPGPAAPPPRACRTGWGGSCRL